MPHVLHLIDHFAIGGAQRALLNLVKEGSRRGFEYHVCCLQGEDYYTRLFEEAGAIIWHLNLGKYDLSATWAVHRLIRRIEPDITHTVLFKANLIGVLLARFNSVPFVIHQQSGTAFEAYRPYFPNDWMTHRYVDLFIRGASAARVLLVSNSSDREYYLSKGIPCEIVRVIPNGLDTDDLTMSEAVYSQKRAAFREQLGLTDNNLLITQIGRLSAEKGPDHTLRAFAKIARHAPHAHLCFVGDGPERARLETIVNQGMENIQGQIHILGFYNDLQEALSGTDILAVGSVREAFGMVILEAWLQRRPVVATACGGPSDLVTSGLDGLLVPIGEIDAFAAALLELVGNESLRQSLGERGYQTLCERYTIQQMQRQFEELYLDILATE